jgi:thiol-disulfide isomerase/thioredoxin
MKKSYLCIITIVLFALIVGLFVKFDNYKDLENKTITEDNNKNNDPQQNVPEEKPNNKGENATFKKLEAKKFKLEHEELNGVVPAGRETPYTTITVSEDNPFRYVDYAYVKELLQNGTGVLYLGFPKCPWCRSLVPTLTDVLIENNIEEAYYFNALSIRDIKSLDEEGNIVVEKEGTDEYYELLDMLSEHLGPYQGLNDESIKRLYFPTVVFVKDGQIVGVNEGTVESQTNPQVLLDEEQTTELKNILTLNLEKTYPQKCKTEGTC